MISGLLKKASGILKLTLGTKNLIDFHTILDELWETTREEIDFEKEAANLDLFYANQKEIAYTTCPVVYHELTTPRLLVMDYIDGIQIDHIEELKSLGYDMTEIGEKTAENYCKQILEDGFFHGGSASWKSLDQQRADCMAGSRNGRTSVFQHQAAASQSDHGTS